MPALSLPQKLLALLKPALPEMIATLERFAVAESPSLEKEPADRCCEIIAAEWRSPGLEIRRITQKNRGDHLRMVAEPKASTSAKKQLLVLGHYDTVYARGTLEKMPFRVTGGKAYGPGVFDMKAGIVQALFAHYALQKLNVSVNKRLVFLWTSDEEIGSQSSQKLIEGEARRSDAVFVLEPSFGPRGLLKTQRKGVGEAEIIVRGRASHAGLAPEEGVNAIHELCNQLSRR
jgi:glutamate carboxypeptidase